MSKTVSEKAIGKLLVDVKIFDSMSNAQKAALRARVSRYLGIIGDPDNAQYDKQYANILTRVQDRVGKAASRAGSVMTIESLEQEYSADFAAMSARQQAAFKAKTKRLYNKAVSMDNTDTVDRANTILISVERQEKEARRSRILELAKQANIIGGDDE